MQISALSSIIQNFQLILNFPFNYMTNTILGTVSLDSQKIKNLVEETEY